MKSSDSQLKSRGKISDNELWYYSDYDQDELLEMLGSNEAYKRTIAVRMLSEKYDLNNNLTLLFLQTLQLEKKLYTKIELCDALSKGDMETAKMMVGYLGQIGNNQHTVLPTKGFNKNSYPLPRDIIARTLARMNVDVLPVLMEVLNSGGIPKIREVIDAIGFISFYNKLHANAEKIDILIQCLRNNYEDNIIRWKVIRAFGSFNCGNINEILTDIKQHDCQLAIRREAERSLRIIGNRSQCERVLFAANQIREK